MDIYLKARPSLGQFSEVSLGPITIVSEAHLDWLWRQMPEQLEILKREGVGLNDVLLTCQKFTQTPRSIWASNNRLEYAQALTFLEAQKELWYLDEMAQKIEAQALLLPLVAQILFEQFTSHVSRLVLLRDAKGLPHLAVAIKLLDQNKLLYFAYNQGQLAAVPVEGLSEITGQMQIRNIEKVDVPFKTGNVLEIIGYNRKKLKFQVTGRSPADRAYESDERLYQNAQGDERVPIEIYFHPYYRAFGHTTIRIGKTMYELSSLGWRAHGLPTSSARAFIFNNPFFKNQLERFRARGMAPFSIGKVILLPKAQVERIHVQLENLCAMKGFRKPRFNIFLNNCNQGLTAVLEQSQLPGLQSRGYMGFSSVLTFRKFLFELDFESESHRLYVMSGFSGGVSALRAAFPKHIYRDNSMLSEIRRGWPVYLADLTMGPLRWIHRNFAKVFGLATADNNLIEGGPLHG